MKHKHDIRISGFCLTVEPKEHPAVTYGSGEWLLAPLSTFFKAIRRSRVNPKEQRTIIGCCSSDPWQSCLFRSAAVTMGTEVVRPVARVLSLEASNSTLFRSRRHVGNRTWQLGLCAAADAALGGSARTAGGPDLCGVLHRLSVEDAATARREIST